MRQQTSQYIRTALQNFNGFFHSEEEIQLYLADYLRRTNFYDNVFVEYYVSKQLIPNYHWQNDKKIAVDIVLQKDNVYLPLEIKYKTAFQVFPHFVFGTNHNVQLNDQKAQNEGCYSFWKDVRRIELFHSTFQTVEKGLVLFITNDSSYRRQARANCGYEPFSIHQGRQVASNTFLTWNGNIPEKRVEKFPGFSVDSAYSINWTTLNIPQHYYILT
jgi:hypothetical protein